MRVNRHIRNILQCTQREFSLRIYPKNHGSLKQHLKEFYVIFFDLLISITIKYI